MAVSAHCAKLNKRFDDNNITIPQNQSSVTKLRTFHFTQILERQFIA